MTSEILFERRGAIGLVTLNRPQALNALTLGMIRAFDPQLVAWEKDAAIKAVAIRGAGGRAFCAGGDVRAIYDAGKAGGRLTQDFFYEEYTLNHRIHKLAKPYVALIDGVTMGGGVGLSVHGRYRVATERTVFAMPETGIGLFPDVGGGYFLPRLPGEIGMFLAMTGERLRAADCLYARIATHVVQSARIDDLVEALARGGDIEAALASISAPPEPAPLARHRDTIDRRFAAGSVEAIIAALKEEGSDWASKQRAAMLAKSPTSMKLAFRQLRAGKAMSLAEDLRMEYRIAQGCMGGHDYYEGVRALIVDKDNAPRWKPARLEEVGEEIMSRHFDAAPARGDLILE